jgi:hypothetical protein
MTDRKRLIVTILILIAAAGAFVLGLIILPDTLVMQVTASGQPGTQMPKLIGLLIPLVLSAVFGILYCKKSGTKTLIGALVGIGMFALTFAFNL